MLERCRNPHGKDVRHYRDRGITVCPEWESFEAFYRDMGPAPADHSLDRVDNARGYYPANCRWATRREQQRNKRTNRLLTLNGETMPLVAWAERTGLRRDTITRRLRRGWSVEKTLTTPLVRAVNTEKEYQ